MITHRPCGACGKLVPADTGCQHWTGTVRRDYRAQQERRAAQRQRDLEAAQRLAEDVKAFHAKMGYGAP